MTANNTITITFVRHGQTTLNLAKKIQTRTDALLSENGIAQAEALGMKLADEDFTRVYTSDLTRAVNTAELILKHNKHSRAVVDIVKEERLRERDYGDWENQDVTVMHDQAKLLGVRMHTLEAPNGESYRTFKEKSLDFFKDLCTLVEVGKPDENILVVGHGGWILTLFEAIDEERGQFQVENLVVDVNMRSPKNTTYTQVQLSQIPDSERYRVNFLVMFEDSHLNGLLEQ